MEVHLQPLAFLMPLWPRGHPTINRRSLQRCRGNGHPGVMYWRCGPYSASPAARNASSGRG